MYKRQLVDFEQLELSPGAARLPEGAQVDLGALGKGWAGDEAIAVLRKCGVSSALQMCIRDSYQGI